MTHALIIDDNMIISRAIQSCLESLGFNSFDHTWTEEQAVAAAARHPPDLVVIGDELEAGSALSAAKRISSDLTVPVLMVTGDPVRTRRRLERTASFAGPFLLNQIEEAVELARSDLCDRRSAVTADFEYAIQTGH
jgi:CheY-like chemotaxis protein